MDPLFAILVCDGDAGFREALRNFLFAAGYSRVDVVASVGAALAQLRREDYRCILFGLAGQPSSVARRLAAVTQRRQPQAKLLFIVDAADARDVDDASLVCVIRERAFSTLLDSLPQDAVEGLATAMTTG
ncbi:MAG: hypothetical protein ABI831_28775 [Betaproteobacteria bacterium]